MNRLFTLTRLPLLSTGTYQEKSPTIDKSNVRHSLFLILKFYLNKRLKIPPLCMLNFLVLILFCISEYWLTLFWNPDIIGHMLIWHFFFKIIWVIPPKFSYHTQEPTFVVHIGGILKYCQQQGNDKQVFFYQTPIFRITVSILS